MGRVRDRRNCCRRRDLGTELYVRQHFNHRLLAKRLFQQPAFLSLPIVNCWSVLRLVVWTQDSMTVAATYGERNGRIKNQKRFDRHSALVSSTVGPMSSSLSACTRSRMRARSYARVMQDARQSAAVTLNQMVFWVVVQGRSSLRYLPGRRVVSPSVIRVRVPVSRIKFEASRMEVVIAAPVLLASCTERVDTTIETSVLGIGLG